MKTFKNFLIEKAFEIPDEYTPTNSVTIHHNPSASQTKALLDKHRYLRGTHTREHGVFLWNGYDAIHYHVRNKLADNHGFNITKSENDHSDNNRDFNISHREGAVHTQGVTKEVLTHPSLKQIKIDHNF